MTPELLHFSNNLSIERKEHFLKMFPHRNSFSELSFSELVSVAAMHHDLWPSRTISHILPNEEYHYVCFKLDAGNFLVKLLHLELAKTYSSIMVNSASIFKRHNEYMLHIDSTAFPLEERIVEDYRISN